MSKAAAPRFCQNMPEVQMLEYIERLVAKASRYPIEVHVSFYSERKPIYQVYTHCFSRGRVTVACFIFCPQNFASLSQNSWDMFYENIKDSINKCRIENLVKLV